MRPLTHVFISISWKCIFRGRFLSCFWWSKLVINSNLYEIQTVQLTQVSEKIWLKRAHHTTLLHGFLPQSFICSKKRRIQCSYKSEHDIIASWHGLLRSLTNASAACQLACWETRHAHVKIIILLSIYFEFISVDQY